ncbi:MAG: 3-hydroxyacyl-CoA dehydrogenase family protein [Deltaproteobacteria bacterium]|nr:3-hydroxyacyl-CoA dehydrogenase family protein [Deltaproteobacteria bacterium]
MEFQRIGVVGAGVMGRGVSQALAMHGMDVLLVDVDAEALDAAREEIRQGMRMHGLFGREAVNADECLPRILFSTDMNCLAEADFVVENITEQAALKEPLYHRLDTICRPDTRIAANTSVISITKIGSWTKRPDKILGMHFMNPVPLKPVVEVIRGHHTSEDTLAVGKAFLKQMKKRAVVVSDMPGFVSNRVLMLTVNEAIWTVQDNVARPEDVDRIFKSCFGHAMGPLETGDLIGLDTILLSLEGLYESYNDPKFRPCPLLRKMVDAGLLGRKSGKGFYEYA